MRDQTTGPSQRRESIPKAGYFQLERGRYGPVFPRTPACYGFSIIAKVKAGREDAIREHGKTIQAAITETPEFLAPLRQHYLRWMLFDVGDGLTFQYQGIFDTDFDKYTEDAEFGITGSVLLRLSARGAARLHYVTCRAPRTSDHFGRSHVLLTRARC